MGRAWLVVCPGDSIHVELDFSELGKVRFSGNGADNNVKMNEFHMFYYLSHDWPSHGNYEVAADGTPVRKYKDAASIIILITALINCCLYKNIAPEYFSTPWKSIYTVFRIFTIEGWYEIPDAIAAASTPFIAKATRLYFCLLLCGGGIIGMSFINSVFVDAMVEDNNDDMKEQLNRIEEKLEKLQEELNKKETK